jgi:hypothetical protein
MLSPPWHSISIECLLHLRVRACSEKVADFFDRNMLHHHELARFLIDRMISSGRKAR